MWTQFMDMHSGGGSKEDHEFIYIEAPESEAKVVFYNRFGHNPERVTCTCCGEDYSISESKTLEDATGYERGCDNVYFRPDGTECPQDEAWKSGKGMTDGYSNGYAERASTGKFSFGKKYVTLDSYIRESRALFINVDEITDDEQKGTVPDQGYVWQD